MKFFTHLPYRNNVSCIVFKVDKILLVQLTDWRENWWKFPQGGVEKGETEIQAVKRELFEELGSTKFEIIDKSKFTNQYDWVEKVILDHGSRWRGQFQKFFVVEFKGVDSDIKINKDEVRKYKWVDKDTMLDMITNVSNLSGTYKPTIIKVLNEFSSEIRKRGYSPVSGTK